MDRKEVLETIEDAEEYIKSLETLQKELKKAEIQIVTSSENTTKNIEEYFANITREITQLLQNRAQMLINKTKQICSESLAPINSSQTIITEKIKQTQDFIQFAKGSNITDNDFSNKASNLGSLPQVPELKEVSCVTFQYDSKVVKDFFKEIALLGSVIPIAPVQIQKILQKPGALLIQWNVLENEENFMEIQEFHLQMATGVAEEENLLQFRDIYKGQECQFLVQDLNNLQEYCFRIRCKFECCSYYSPWSVVQSSKLLMEPYKWQGNANFLLANNSKIAANLKENSTILSNGAYFKVGDCVDFTFLECDNVLKDCFVGLLPNDRNFNDFQLKDKQEGFLVEFTGNIYIDGVKKATVLPSVSKNSKITFTSSLINAAESQEKLRISIDINEKQVTYDWIVDTAAGFYFLAHLKSGKWKILVE